MPMPIPNYSADPSNTPKNPSTPHLLNNLAHLDDEGDS